MSVIRKSPDMVPALRSRRFWTMLALGIALTPLNPFMASAGWAENYTLDSVDFASTGGEMNIMLHTGSIVPVQKVLESDDKMILEIDQINTDGTVQTNFSGASNISHVIMQPINDHKMRMIVRGERLGKPNVAFFNNTPENDYNNLHRQTTAALQQLQDSGMQAANWNPTAQTVSDGESEISAKPTPEAAAKPATLTAPKPADDEESIPFGGFLSSSRADKPAEKPATTSKRPTVSTDEKTAPLSIPAADMPGVGQDLLDALGSGKANNLILGGLLGLLALGMGGFVVQRIMKLKQADPDLEDLLAEQTQGKRVSFKEMASAYRNKHDRSQLEALSLEADGKGKGKKTSSEDVIGLRSLNQMDESELIQDIQEIPQRPAPKPAKASKPQPGKPAAASKPGMPKAGQTPTMEQLIAMVQAVSEPKQPETPAKQPPAPQKQVIHQYMQNQTAKAKVPAKKAMASDEVAIKEQKRAKALQQDLIQQAQQQINAAQAAKLPPKGAPVNRALAAQKAAKPANPIKSGPVSAPLNAQKRPLNSPAKNTQLANQGPLPGNPEVLNFLRNVADLMEKDGKPQIAQSIHKNLSPNKPGRA